MNIGKSPNCVKMLTACISHIKEDGQNGSYFTFGVEFVVNFKYFMLNDRNIIAFHNSQL